MAAILNKSNNLALELTKEIYKHLINKSDPLSIIDNFNNLVI